MRALILVLGLCMVLASFTPSVAAVVTVCHGPVAVDTEGTCEGGPRDTLDEPSNGCEGFVVVAGHPDACQGRQDPCPPSDPNDPTVCDGTNGCIGMVIIAAGGCSAGTAGGAGGSAANGYAGCSHNGLPGAIVVVGQMNAPDSPLSSSCHGGEGDPCDSSHSCGYSGTDPAGAGDGGHGCGHVVVFVVGDNSCTGGDGGDSSLEEQPGGDGGLGCGGEVVVAAGNSCHGGDGGDGGPGADGGDGGTGCQGTIIVNAGGCQGGVGGSGGSGGSDGEDGADCDGEIEVNCDDNDDIVESQDVTE